MATIEKGNRKVVRAWTIFDCANSAYSLVITSALFPIYFNAVTTNDQNKEVQFLGRVFNSDSLQTYTISFAFLLIALLSPMLSSMADYSGKKKKFMFMFSTLGALSCVSLYFFTGVDTLWIGVFGSMLAAIGYAGSIVFYNAFLPEIAEPIDHDRISARGFSVGYLGSSLLLIFCLTMVMFPDWYGGISSGQASRISFLLVGVWWLGFGQVTFNALPETARNEDRKISIITGGYKELKLVWSQLKTIPILQKFLIAFFFYNMGTQTVMYVATLFGTSELHLETSILIAIILIIQFVAIAGAFLFSKLSSKLGNIKALFISIFVWILICIAAYFCDKKYGFNEQNYFICLAAAVGLVMGGIQSLSRSTYSKMLPETDDHAAYFSFFDVCDKFGTVLGTLCFGLINELSGSMRNSIILLTVFFIIGIIFLRKIDDKKISINFVKN